jgi:C1A family cysteine protease
MNRGAMKNVDYPYAARNQNCQYTAAKKIFELENCTKVDSNLVMLKSQIFNQPVIVSFDASDTKFMQYGGGLYIPPPSCGSKINHYMLAVGWGEVTTGAVYKKTQYYIIVKNSMGIKWGDNGFGKVVVQVDKDLNNACGLLKEIYFPFG